MECRRFEINLISASDLKNVREIFKMKVYAVISIMGDSQTEKRTPVDKINETNPVWNFNIKYTVGKKTLQNEEVKLVIKLYCERSLGDRYIGEVQTSIKQLYDHADPDGGSVIRSYPVQRDSATSQGELKLSCSFGETVTIQPPSTWKKILVVGTLDYACGS
ncbi:hypothetical protein F0562_028102 [Nyssa sinensis]|uniref:C2 domain-containing protein n=1 Tax=Nyssa sinensis TaxID=561372 RepID=A0A5J5B9U0_9ASTE|nr:hypothetical protein F0562_028102 [Nyssa sinensis]